MFLQLTILMRYPVHNQTIVKPSSLERTTIIISRKNIGRLMELGRYNDTLDRILNRLVDNDIKLHGTRVLK